MSDQHKKSCFLCGVGGSGMSALAQLLLAQGWDVSGSDRSRDKGETPEKFSALAAQGVTLYPQDGSGLRAGMEMLIVSSAVEDTIPDVRAAKALGIPVRKRAEVLAGYFNAAETAIAVGGTSGKSTVTAMTGWIFAQAQREPTIVNGALMNNFEGGNMVAGRPGLVVAEVDESDGSIALFRPSVSVLTNISLDHKPMPELRQLFGDYVAAARGAAVLNFDDPEARALAGCSPDVRSFSLQNEEARFQARNIRPSPGGIAFILSDHQTGEDVPVHLQVPGHHNVFNALAAMAAAHAGGINLKTAAQALEAFKGTKRRFEVVGQARGITVIDDFAHNPDKIAATLRTLKDYPGRVWAIFQPHGFRPTKLMAEPLVEALAAGLGAEDMLLMPEIYYAGGTAEKVISSEDIVRDVKARGRNARFFERREQIPPFLREKAQSGDIVIVMGARDDTLPGFAREILKVLG